MRTWVVIYQMNLGFVYGWLCKGERIAEIEENFWIVLGSDVGKTIRCIAELNSPVFDSYVSLFEQKEA